MTQGSTAQTVVINVVGIQKRGGCPGAMMPLRQAHQGEPSVKYTQEKERCSQQRSTERAEMGHICILSSSPGLSNLHTQDLWEPELKRRVQIPLVAPKTSQQLAILGDISAISKTNLNMVLMIVFFTTI